MRLEGKTAVVTGGNSGIGLAIAKSFKEEGARVAIFGRNPDSLASAVQELGDGSISVQGDVSQSEDLDRLYSEVDAKFGKVDVLVANAGIGEFVPLDAADDAEADSQLRRQNHISWVDLGNDNWYTDYNS